jgi:hypothetical protein
MKSGTPPFAGEDREKVDEPAGKGKEHIVGT